MRRLAVTLLALALVRIAAELVSAGVSGEDAARTAETNSAATRATAYAQEEDEGLRGKALYLQYCSQCHGETGDGEGIAAPLLSPKPRDFTTAQYKIRSTQSGELPTDADLERVILEGLPYTAMPAFDWLTDSQVDSLIEVVKSFSEDFQDPELAPEPVDLPDAPGFSAERAEAGREVYERTGCALCHGNLGRGDGRSAPTLRDNNGDFIPVADLTMPWTFRAGGTQADIFRTMSVGFNGTPMPGFAEALSEEERWQITDYMLSLAWSDPEDPYADFVSAVGVDGEIDLDNADALFAAAEAEPALLPVIGQIIQPGRTFTPAAQAIQAQAIYNQREIAIRLVWHDMTAETEGRNAPDIQVADPKVPGEPLRLPGTEPPAPAETGSAATGTGGAGTPSETGGVDAAADAVDSEDAAPTAVAAGVVSAASEPATEGPFSDAVAVQLPRTAPEGVRWPYFLFGDPQNPVDLWFADLAGPEARMYAARGSDQIEPADAGELEVRAGYNEGAWTVTFKRPLTSAAGVNFVEDEFVPIAFTVWDGRSEEHGNRRGLTRWYSIYLEPLDKPSAIGPVLRAGLGVLGLELLLIFAVRRYRRRQALAQGD